jgi:excisionase family DNA binding protein
MTETALLTVRELAKEARVPISLIYKLISAGELAVIRTSARSKIRIEREAWADWVRRHRVPAKDDDAAPKPPPRVAADSLPGSDRYVR